jgi:hypothetical protein
MNEADLFLMLRARYESKDYALIPRVADGTGATKTRTVDALAMCLYPSRGNYIHGFEIKVSRADWLVELKNPAKAEAIARYCDRWWLVVSDDSFVKPGELPERWGLLAVKAGRLKVIHPAPILPSLVPDYLRPFLAAMQRAAQENGPSIAELTAARLEGHRVGSKGATETAARELRKKVDELAALQHIVAQFETASGVHISRYNAAKIGEAVKFVLAGGVEGNRAELLRQQATFHRITNSIDRQVEQLDLIPPLKGAFL